MAHLPCPPELWPDFSTLLDEALELSQSEQFAWLSALAPRHAAVRPWLEKVLLQKTASANSRFMEGPAGSQLQTPEFAPQQIIGPYQLERLLGRGGMGEVWLATRTDRTPNRRIALKLPHAFLLAGVHRRRFERERDILAALSHPHIAQLYDAGVADDKHPYLAMEWVDGLPIHQWCRAQKLSLDARLALFRQVLEAVGYAHAQFIAHRDLKPSNILVTQTGQVKLLDFGIAKLLDGERSGEATELTRAGGRAATPDYAAPEQLTNAPVTTAVDVYALGVVLHELLTGQRPPPSSHGPAPVLRLASASVDPQHAEDVSGLQPRQLRRALNGDLDAILVKALEPDPKHRYRSVEALAEDLHRSRDHRPIAARHIGPATLMLKFVRRHQLGVAMSLALVTALILGSAGIAWQAVRAEREAQRATQIKDFLVSMFRASDPSVASDKPRGSITARELLDLNADRIEREFADDPRTAIELLGVTANIYFSLGESSRYEELHQHYRLLALNHYGRLSAPYLDSLLDDSRAAINLGDAAKAMHLLDSLDTLLRQAGLDASPLRGRWWLQRSQALKLSDAAADEQRSALDHAIPLLARGGQTNESPLSALVERGFSAIEQLDYAGAIPYFNKALAIGQESGPQQDGELQRAYYGLAQALSHQAKFNAAAEAYEQASALSLRTFGIDDWHYWEITAAYARLLHMRGDRERADAMFENLIRHSAKFPTSDSNSAIAITDRIVRVQFARCLIDEGRPQRAIPLIDADEKRYLANADNTINRIRLTYVLGNAYLASGQIEQARELFKWVVEQLAARGPSGSPELMAAKERLGQALLAAKDFDAARQEFTSVIASSGNQNSESLARSNAGLAELALRNLDVKKAIALSNQSLDTLRRTPGLLSVRVEPSLLRTRAEALNADGDATTALRLLQLAQDQLSAYDAPESSELIGVRNRLSELRSTAKTTTAAHTTTVAAR